MQKFIIETFIVEKNREVIYVPRESFFEENEFVRENKFVKKKFFKKLIIEKFMTEITNKIMIFFYREAYHRDFYGRKVHLTFCLINISS